MGCSRGGNFLIQAPTSSGKTFIGEMAALQTALRRKKVVYLVPLKALAEEKHADFQEKYAAYGIEVIISTRDRREFDAQLESGSFSIAVVVYEKLAQLLVRRPERLKEIELIIADELELLSDPDRGGDAELLLTRILESGTRLIGLSAVIGHADKLAQWMKAELVLHERRPVELRYGVLHNGVFRYRTYNDYSEGEEALVDAYSDSAWEILTENLCAFAGQGQSCLVFVKARHESRHGAELLADRVDLPPGTDAIEAIRRLESTHSRDCLLHTLARGVGFHNADLCREERQIVEDAFRRGEIKVLVSTSTLAVGMNLPAQNVFITAEKWQYDSRFGMPWKAPILRAEYENMGGRAGRYGAKVAFGRSLLIAPTPFDQETLWRRYIEGERERIEPQLARTPLENHVVRLVASRCCPTEEALRRFLESTLTGTWMWTQSLTLEEMESRVRAAVNRAVDAGMVTKNAEGRLEATPFGQAAAAKGITLATAQELAQWIHESETRRWSDIDLLLAAAMTHDGRMLQVSLTSAEYEHAGYVEQLKRLTQDEDLAADVPLNRIRNCTLMPFFEEVRAIKVALLLSDWIDEAGVYDLEEQFHTSLGQVIAAAEQIGWLIDAATAIASAFGAQTDFIERVAALAGRVAFGVRPDALPLACLRLPGLERAVVTALEARGLHTPQALAQAAPGLLTQWLAPAQAETLLAWARRNAAAAAGEAPPPPAAGPPVLVVDDRHPGEIRLDGTPIPLQDKQYRLIRSLAAAPGECVPYDTIYTAVWGESIVEPNQMHFQKRRLIERIKAALPERARLITTVPKRGFVLNLPADRVELIATAPIPAPAPAGAA
ncbi:MAG: DEAD/DEAH box helicase [Candidatus Hydrogenedentes bacterium]|nr:DEAD/DEAH box helicase [Candidatus Hydrogenedentota bacterium]